MGPKRTDNTGKGAKLSQAGIGGLNTIGGASIGEQEYQQCVGKFAADLELCCREPSPGYPIPIPVYIRGHPPVSSRVQTYPSQNFQQPQSRTHSRASITPSVVGGVGEEQLSTIGKKTFRTRVSSTGQSGILIGITGVDNESRSLSITGQEQSKRSSSPYRTFHVLNDSDYYQPKLLVDSVNNETESIDQITALYMRAWLLDQRFIDILKKVLLLQEQLHTLNFCYVGLNEQSMNGLVELCQVTKNLKNLILDGNPLSAEYFYLLIEKDDSKITHLSLRFCEITDASTERLANALGNMFTQNWKLLSLNLSGNRIGDQGANSFATALRYNRTLISLNLSSNFITDKGALSLALVLRRIVLTSEEIVRRRYLLAERYAETHPDDLRNNANSPTPSNISAKSKSGRNEWKRLTDPNKKKANPSKIAQIVVDKRNRPESDENRPASGSKGDLKKGRNEGSGSGTRSSTLNPPPVTGNTSRRIATNTSNSSNKDSDQPRTSGPARVKKIAAAVSAATKKNITIVKEEDEDTFGEFISLQIQQVDRENPLLETNEIESHDGEIWLKGNFILLNLNLSRNYLTLDSVKEFLLSIQQQSALTQFTDVLNLSSALIDFSGLCRLELKGMNDISTKSLEYQSLETLLIQKNPSNRFQQIKDRETKEYLDQQSIQTSQQLQPVVPEKTTNITEKIRAGANIKTKDQRPTSKLKE